MGAQIDLPEGEHKLLAERIEAIVLGCQSFLSYPENVERLAQMYASQVIRRLSTPTDNSEHPKDENLEPEFVSIDINSIEKTEPRTVGAEHLMLQMANQLELPGKLQEVGLSKTDISIALGSIIARAVHPDSERATHTWLCDASGLGELLDFDFKKSSLDKLYQISDKLIINKDVLEGHFETVESKFHGYKSTIALYDLTNTYMAGQAKSNPKAAHGHSKEKRSDCPLVTMGLVMNEHGFLHRTSILPGNASEPKTLEEMIVSLNAHQSLFKPTVLLDAGIATKDNLEWLRGQGYTYVVSAREKVPSVDLEGELVSVGDLNNFVKAALIKSEDNSEEKWLYCESEAKAAVASEMKESFRRRFEDAFRFMKSSLGLRPVYHQKEHRVDGHLWITIMAYHLIQHCLYQLKKQGLSHQWKTIREMMKSRIRVTMRAITEAGKIFYHRSSTKAESEQKEIYRALGITPQILKARKTFL